MPYAPTKTENTKLHRKQATTRQSGTPCASRKLIDSPIPSETAMRPSTATNTYIDLLTDCPTRGQNQTNPHRGKPRPPLRGDVKTHTRRLQCALPALLPGKISGTESERGRAGGGEECRKRSGRGKSKLLPKTGTTPRRPSRTEKMPEDTVRRGKQRENKHKTNIPPSLEERQRHPAYTNAHLPSTP